MNGRKITRTEAQAFIEAYSQGREPDKDWIWGQKYSLQLLKEFMQTIDDYNNASPTDPITDIRIYYAKSTRAVGNRPATEYPDLVIVPVNEKDDDPYYQKNDGEIKMKDGGDGGMGGGMPCPNVCP